MVMDIKTQIGQILYERDSLIIPNLGGFVSAYKSATIDHVQGLIHPPSKKLSFNKNLIINDGVLINCLQEALDMSVAEAQKTIEDFVSRTVEMLDNREIIVFPGVGRLYKDYENNIQFLQDNTNYNTAVYGLPALQYYPILRSRSIVGNNVSDTIAQPQTAGRSVKFRRAATAILPFALIAIITVGTFMFYNQQKSSIDEPGAVPISANRINQKPGDQLSIMEGLKNKITKPEPKEQFEVPEVEVEEPAPTTNRDTESATLSPKSKECVIIIGAFGKKAGVEKRVGEIIDLGYSVYQDKKGKLTRVGIQFAYQEEDEIREKLDAMRDNFDNHAWVLNE